MKMTSDERNSSTGHKRSRGRLTYDLGTLSPAYFGMVMATGIVSLAAHLLDVPSIAQAFFQLNIFVYGVLWLLTVVRIARYPHRFFGDMVDHLRGPGFFTTVAGTSVLGSQFVLLAADYRAATVLWVVAILLWILLTYTIFAGFTIKEHKPTLDQGISGAWLLAVVATQSIAVLSALLATHVGQPGKLEMNFLALSMWLWGGMLYIWMMSLIFYLAPCVQAVSDEIRPAVLGRGLSPGHVRDQMIAAMGFDFLRFLPVAFLYISLAAWTGAFAG
jgi:tellurite resistance protein TehA-like permease